MNKDWNPDLYLKFDKERTQPSIDLVRRISFDKPGRIIDIGCGPGNSTQVLAERWPGSDILGVDKSPSMIEKAKNDFPDQEWRILDVGTDYIDGKFDIVFSNATIQWIPNHAELLKKLRSLLGEHGVLAVQIPLFWDMPLGKSIVNIASEDRWAVVTGGVSELFTIHDYSCYYDILSGLFSSTDFWITDYIHVLDSQASILNMIKSTGLKPYLDSLECDSDKDDFEKMVLSEIEKDYPLQKNGKVLFPFKRLFLISTI
jgi:trans-aconitate 2-methyltransferase